MEGTKMLYGVKIWLVIRRFLLFLRLYKVFSMEQNGDADILRLLWSDKKQVYGRRFGLASGGEAVVRSCGEHDRSEDIYAGAEVELDGVVLRGDVVFGVVPPERIPRYAVLQVVSAPSVSLVRFDGWRIPQMILPVPEELRRSVGSLHYGAGSYECGLWLADADRIKRVSIMENLMLERLERKCGDVMQVFEESGRDWQQTFHVMLFRAMGGNRNREPYMRLASRATYSMVLRERSSVTMVEALLLGTSGLLEGCYFDDYIHQLRDHYKYLCSKYRLTPMHAHEWESGGTYPRSMPIQRIVQLASFLSGNEFVFDRMTACRTRDDVQVLFSAEASHYWTTHYIPDGSSKRCPKRIGEEKADLLGMNLVVPMMFAYGNYTGKEELKEAAVGLLASIPPESNVIIRGWTGKGVPVSSAMDSQALLQLSNEYCIGRRCTDCRIGRRLIKML